MFKSTFSHVNSLPRALLPLLVSNRNVFIQTLFFKCLLWTDQMLAKVSKTFIGSEVLSTFIKTIKLYCYLKVISHYSALVVRIVTFFSCSHNYYCQVQKWNVLNLTTSHNEANLLQFMIVNANWTWLPIQTGTISSQEFSHQGGDRVCVLYCKISKNLPLSGRLFIGKRRRRVFQKKKIHAEAWPYVSIKRAASLNPKITAVRSTVHVSVRYRSSSHCACFMYDLW